jgi:hypothetical protein
MALDPIALDPTVSFCGQALIWRHGRRHSVILMVREAQPGRIYFCLDGAEHTFREPESKPGEGQQ